MSKDSRQALEDSRQALEFFQVPGRRFGPAVGSEKALGAGVWSMRLCPAPNAFSLPTAGPNLRPGTWKNSRACLESSRTALDSLRTHWSELPSAGGDRGLCAVV